MLTVLTAIFNFWGFAVGSIVIIILMATNKTVCGGRSYLYPLIPFDGRALLSLFVRMKKPDVKYDDENAKGN